MGRGLKQFIGIVQVELHFHPFTVVFHGFDAQAKVAGDLAGSFPFAQQAKDFPFPIAQIRHAL